MAHSRIKALLATGSLAAAAFFGLSQPAYPVHDTAVFELDGNVSDPGGGGDDWATVATGGPSPARTGLIADAAPATIFTGGGSKDDLDLSGPLSGAGGWKHKNGSVPDKDDITNAYAAAYNVGGKLVIYAGADRFDNSGDAFMGFWFFQNQIGTGPIQGNSGPFIGTHAFGDVLVLANFTGGGTTVNIEVLRWIGNVRTGVNPANIVNNTLERIAGIAGGTPATCSAVGANDPFCGITNLAPGGPGEPPWTYVAKGGATTFPTATFFEVGINISDVFSAAGAGTVPCFSSFMAETRSSSSVSAVLKDFALGGFEVCGITVSKVCKSPVLIGADTVGYTIEGRVQNTGFGTLQDVSLSDNPTEAAPFQRYACNGNTPTGPSLGTFGTGVSLAPGASVCYQTTFNTTTNGQDDVVTATASTGSSTVSSTAGADCPDIRLNPKMIITKTCTTALAQENNKLVVKVNIAGSVCNDGPNQVDDQGQPAPDFTPLLGVSVTDTDVSGNLLGTPQNILAGACVNFTNSYFPSTAENRITFEPSTLIPGLARFSDTVTATATAPLNAPVANATATAACTLCPTCTTSGDQCTGTSCPQSRATSQSKQFLKQTR